MSTAAYSIGVIPKKANTDVEGDSKGPDDGV
jgi:hypothetical protein